MKPRIAFINGSGNGSTGRICYFLARFGENNGWETNRFFSFACPPGQSQDGVPFQLVEESSIQYFANRVLCRANGSDACITKEQQSAFSNSFMHFVRMLCTFTIFMGIISTLNYFFLFE